MRVLLAVDGSSHTEVLADDVSRRYWASGTEIEVITVIHSRFPLIPDPAFTMVASYVQDTLQRTERAPGLVDAVADRIRRRQPRTVVTTQVLEGPPAEMILREADGWKADLIVMGSHGHSGVWQALLGSTASAVASTAPCPVEIIRSHKRPVRVHDPETVVDPAHLHPPIGATHEAQDASPENVPP
jgi:nucleotide-binding universal stress UspA family protein